MAFQLTACKANTRGKNTREITFEGIGKLVIEQVPVMIEGADGKKKSQKAKDGSVVTEPKEHLVSDGALTDIKDAMELSSNKQQFFLDRFAEGYNEYKLRLASDQLAAYVNPAWSSEVTSAFRLMVNNLLKLPGNPGVEKAVEIALQFVTAK